MMTNQDQAGEQTAEGARAALHDIAYSGGGKDSFDALGRFIDQYDAMKGQRDDATHHLRNLLAIIHRDSGHYVEEHGPEKAVEDAHKVWADLQVAADERDDALRALADVLPIARAGLVGLQYVGNQGVYASVEAAEDLLSQQKAEGKQ